MLGSAVTCSGCAASAPELPLTWSTERGHPDAWCYYCERCTRASVAGIEARLDLAWWE